MRRVCLSFVIAFSSLISHEAGKEDMITSQEANYDGSSLKLSGHVVLDHAFGIMQAEEAILDKAEESKEFPFSNIHLKDQVVVHPVASGTLTCAMADFNFETMKAYFFGTPGRVVKFEEDLDSKNGKRNKIVFESPFANMTMRTSENLKDLNAYLIESIESKGDSTFSLNGKIFIEAPKVTFKKGNSSNKQYAGEVLAVSDGDLLCILKSDKDRIESSHMQLDITSEMIALAHAKGKIDSFEHSSPLEFTCDKLIWDEKKNLLNMHGHVFCKEKGLGVFATENSLSVSFDKQEERKELVKMVAEGPAKLRIEDVKQGTVHDLYCPKSLEMDRKTLQATLSSHGDKPIRYLHPAGVIYAKHGFIQYAEKESEIKPVMAKLEGQIRLLASDEKNPKVCVADRLDFTFDDQKIIVYAENDKRVLYWDKVAGVTISATEVHITRDPTTGVEEVRGIGNVRFSFSEAEKELIKKHYPQYSK